MELKAKYQDKDVWIHYASLDKVWMLISYTLEKTKLFKVDKKDLVVDEKQLDAYLLVQVEKRQ